MGVRLDRSAIAGRRIGARRWLGRVKARHFGAGSLGLGIVALTFILSVQWEHARWEDGSHGLRPTPTPEVIEVRNDVPGPVVTVVVEREVGVVEPVVSPTPEVIIKYRDRWQICTIVAVSARILSADQVAEAASGVMICPPLIDRR